jgi:hypothetical protein
MADVPRRPKNQVASKHGFDIPAFYTKFKYKLIKFLVNASSNTNLIHHIKTAVYCVFKEIQEQIQVSHLCCLLNLQQTDLQLIDIKEK